MATPTALKAPQFPPSATSDMALKTEAKAPDNGVADDDRPSAGHTRSPPGRMTRTALYGVDYAEPIAGRMSRPRAD